MSTIKEVAELAGVSIGTVSHVIGGSVPVSVGLREKVLAAINKLDYHPNHIARSLKTRTTRTLGIIVPDLTIPFYPQVIRSAEAAARVLGYSVIAVNSDDSTTRQKEALSLLRSQRVDGVLLVIASGQGSDAQVQKLIASSIPVVCLDRVPDGVQVDSVCVEDAAAAEMAVSHLISRGHRRIAIVTGPLTLRNERERLAGYKTALRRAGIQPVSSLIWQTKLHADDVKATCESNILRTAGGPTALFCTNGVTGLGALRCIIACGMSTPEDIAFATFDELSADDVFRPGITSVVQPAQEIGSKAAQILIDRIRKGPDAGTRIDIRLPATLKIRESSGAPKKRRASGLVSSVG